MDQDRISAFGKLIVSDLIASGTVKFYRRYVDGTLVLIRSSDIPHVLNKFYSFDKDIKFTVDTFSNGIIHFLDILISTKNTDVYYTTLHTLVNTQTFLVLNLFRTKLHG